MFPVKLPVLSLLVLGSILANEPPKNGGAMPLAFRERLQADPRAFTFRSSLKSLSSRAMVARIRAAGQTFAAAASALSNLGLPSVASTEALGPKEVRGTQSIPVLLSKFNDTPTSPIQRTELQRELFGQWPTGSLTDYYREISYGRLTVNGTVTEWKSVSKNAAHYQGADIGPPEKREPCFGTCNGARLGEYLQESFDNLGVGFDWTPFDNDGPDGRPNSGDDDGVVDFVALVHPGRGGECGSPADGPVNRNIWSHRSSLRIPYKTNSLGKSGGFIEISDYVIMPALACDGTTMIQIGVFAHEFGHAFGLPDLYDTVPSDGRSNGLGNWCLMASGSYGGDNNSPERPTHMSPWAKAFLGWAEIKTLPMTQSGTISFPPSETSPVVYKLPLAANRYYLISHISRTKFNSRLPAAGIAIWRIDPGIIATNESTNQVNADHNHKGVDLVEADGRNSLDTEQHRGGPGDIFTGAPGPARFDATTLPRNESGKSICKINIAAGEATIDYSHNRNICPSPGVPGPAPAQTIAPSEPALNLGLQDANSFRVAVGQAVKLSGTLTNLGKSYFKSSERRIVFQDSTGKQIDATIDLPLESPGRPSLSSILGVRLNIEGRIGRSPSGKPVLQIESATPSKPK